MGPKLHANVQHARKKRADEGIGPYGEDSNSPTDLKSAVKAVKETHFCVKGR